MRTPKASIENAFAGIWSRAKGYVAEGKIISAALIFQWATDRGLILTNAEDALAGIFSPIPAVLLDIQGQRACFPKIGKYNPEWIVRRIVADKTAALWKKVEWFAPLWVSNGKISELLKAIEYRTAATLSTSKKPEELDAANKKFWSLYWGELALVEDKRVEAAMVQFGRALESGSVGQQLQQYSLALAYACRDSLAESWGVKQWRNPHDRPGEAY